MSILEPTTIGPFSAAGVAVFGAEAVEHPTESDRDSDSCEHRCRALPFLAHDSSSWTDGCAVFTVSRHTTWLGLSQLTIGRTIPSRWSLHYA